MQALQKIMFASLDPNFLLADDNDPNWPTETFPITEVKTALEGWKKFLEMPESFDSVVEVYIQREIS